MMNRHLTSCTVLLLIAVAFSQTTRETHTQETQININNDLVVGQRAGSQHTLPGVPRCCFYVVKKCCPVYKVCAENEVLRYKSTRYLCVRSYSNGRCRTWKAVLVTIRRIRPTFCLDGRFCTKPKYLGDHCPGLPKRKDYKGKKDYREIVSPPGLTLQGTKAKKPPGA